MHLFVLPVSTQLNKLPLHRVEPTPLVVHGTAHRQQEGVLDGAGEFFVLMGYTAPGFLVL